MRLNGDKGDNVRGRKRALRDDGEDVFDDGALALARWKTRDKRFKLNASQREAVRGLHAAGHTVFHLASLYRVHIFQILGALDEAPAPTPQDGRRAHRQRCEALILAELDKLDPDQKGVALSPLVSALALAENRSGTTFRNAVNRLAYRGEVALVMIERAGRNSVKGVVRAGGRDRQEA
jgi:hypothetical protein